MVDFNLMMASRLEQLAKLHQADPADAFLTYGIALENAKAGCLDEAIVWLDKTLEIDPDYCYAYFQKAVQIEAKGNKDAACAVLKDGIETAKKIGDEHACAEMTELLESMDT